MRRQYHILNGDSLKERFPKNIQGEIIVARECLVDGNIEGEDLNDFFNTRAKFISSNYSGFSEQEYFEKVVSEFLKIKNIDDNSDINLWFEDDLFCQVNLWFTINLISQSQQSNRLYLVRPQSHNQYGFEGLDELELISIYENKSELTDLHKLARLWECYQVGNTKELIRISKQLKTSYPFIIAAVEAHIQRIPTDRKPGKPTESLIAIMKELETEDFGIVFREFNKRESIYGFGDLQVKRLYDEISFDRRQFNS